MAIGFRPLPLAGGSAPEVITEDKWHQGFINPVRQAGIATALIVASGAVISPLALTQAEAVTESRWHQAWSEPTRTKQGLAARQHQTIAAPVFVQASEIVTLDKWLYQLSEPVRPKLGIASCYQQHLAFVKAAPFPEAVTIDRWLLPLANPAIKPVLLQQGERAFVSLVATPENITPDKWHQPLAEPVRRKGLPTAEQPALSLGPYPITTAVDLWITPFSTPVRDKRPLRHDAQPVLVRVISTEIVTVDKWYQSYSLPKPLRSYKAALAPFSFQSNYLVPAPYIDPPMASWTYSWSTPVRLRVGLLASSQSGAVEPVIPQPNPPTPTGVYTVSGLYVIDQFTDNTVVYNYSGGVSHRTN